MNMLVGSIISGAMMILPILMQFNISQPPQGITGWLVFVVSLGGALSLLQIGLVKFIVNPAILKMLENVPTRAEFTIHKDDDTRFQERVDNFITNYYENTGPDNRHHARRKGDPQ